MATRVCWNCEKDAHMTEQSRVWACATGEGGSQLSGLYVCDNCKRPSMAITEMKFEDLASYPEQQSSLREALEEPETGDGPHWFPVSAVGREFPDVPDHIAQAAREAHEVASIGARHATLVMARAVIEAVAKDKGVATGSLFEKIDALHEKGVIRDYTREGAHEVRHLGNDMAHGDFDEDDEITPADADDALAILREMLGEVYQGPARVKAMNARRAARKSMPF